MKRERAIRIFIIAAAAVVFVFVILGVDRRGLDPDAPRGTLVMPALDDEVWYLGQGLPIQRALLEEGTHPTPAGTVTILPDVLTRLPYKNNEETRAWVDHINATYAPEPRWRHRSERRLGHYKCMSLSASTVRDWLRLRDGLTLGAYTSMLNGLPERGLNPKVLDSLYYESGFDVTGSDHYDPVSGTPVPCDLRGFVKLLTEPPAPHPAPDVSLPGVTYDWTPADLLPDYEVVEIELDADAVVEALRTHGALYAGIRVRFSASGGVMNRTEVGDAPLPFVTGHAVVIVGWIDQGGARTFVYRETFGDYDYTSQSGGAAYRVYPIFGFSEIYGFRRRG